jgi:hypothetical protein
MHLPAQVFYASKNKFLKKKNVSLRMVNPFYLKLSKLKENKMT